MLKTIPSSKLVVGMYLHKLCGSWMQHPFWRSAFLLADPKDIQTIIQSGVSEVVIDTAKGLDIEPLATAALKPEQSPAPAATEAPAVKKLSKAAEWRRAKAICESSKQAITSMFEDARMGKVVSVETAQPLVDEISTSVVSSPDTLITLARLKTCDDYTYMHSVAVCAMMIALARELGLSEEQVSTAGVGGLMHDLGKAAIPLDILNNPGKLTDQEFAVVKNHPLEGYKLLQDNSNISPEVLDIVLHHHEKFDGTGYPEGLQGEDISLLARMSAICDVYDAVTSTRPYKEGWDPALSLKRMISWQGHFDPQILQAFIKIIGIYPIGALVKLESNRLAVVVEQSEGKLLAPKVKVFFAIKPKGPIAVELLDLAATRCKDRIVGLEDAEQWGFKNLADLWQPA
ncbi:HD-GYP domain-containing protein [Dasania sp. GY-MA-18]|uniref:HD-GYP domain-containing protein n=1 Tax=Dasania phycosphaerae TaxID=2950436 RepID=A0A9J6RM06_9GAMM|nr:MULTISPECIES: HD-GYP domain-containing protein [Dasania]MCR8922914.1 HD-GYP domain-containing protein [Dasania sp. GY-MA-18]MCZ0865345.1 HD-GYP domain-containing protein [Dasania phycosphaerae]MCZ0869070.1 HD-GYP domain-containing protein [Dasania phycosphaerae]